MFFYRITLELIQYTGYLTIEEITMFVFIRDPSEISLKIKQTENFRKLKRV